MNRPHDVEDTEQHLCGLDPKIKCQIMFFIVNASLPKLFDVAISDFAGAKIWRALDNILCDLDLWFKVICIFLNNIASSP